MNNDKIDRTIKPRHVESDDRRPGLIPSDQRSSGLFAGWGPRLFSIAIAACALGLSTSAVRASTLASTGAMCALPQRDAALLGNPMPETPEIAELEGITGAAVLRVDLSGEGELESVAVATSSGNPALDQAALQVARETRYAPAISDCQQVASSYLYVVSFER